MYVQGGDLANVLPFNGLREKTGTAGEVYFVAFSRCCPHDKDGVLYIFRCPDT